MQRPTKAIESLNDSEDTLYYNGLSSDWYRVEEYIEWLESQLGIKQQDKNNEIVSPL